MYKYSNKIYNQSFNDFSKIIRSDFKLSYYQTHSFTPSEYECFKTSIITISINDKYNGQHLLNFKNVEMDVSSNDIQSDIVWALYNEHFKYSNELEHFNKNKDKYDPNNTKDIYTPIKNNVENAYKNYELRSMRGVRNTIINDLVMEIAYDKCIPGRDGSGYYLENLETHDRKVVDLILEI